VRVLVVALALLAVGCRVIALGDSNTCYGWPCGPFCWPAQLGRRLDAARALWTVENWAVPGMTAGKFKPRYGTDVSPFTHEANEAMFRLDKILTDGGLAAECTHVVSRWVHPKLLIAVGTNDVAEPGMQPWNVGQAIMALVRHAQASAPCVDVYVATVPPRFDMGLPVLDVIAQTNAYLRKVVPPDRLVDLDGELTPDDLWEDGVHLRWKTHTRRAEAALRALFPTIAP